MKTIQHNGETIILCPNNHIIDDVKQECQRCNEDEKIEEISKELKFHIDRHPSVCDDSSTIYLIENGKSICIGGTTRNAGGWGKQHIPFLGESSKEINTYAGGGSSIQHAIETVKNMYIKKHLLKEVFLMKKVKLPFWICYELDNALLTPEETESIEWTEEQRLEHLFDFTSTDFHKWIRDSENKQLIDQAIKLGYEEVDDLDPEDNVLKVYLNAKNSLGSLNEDKNRKNEAIEYLLQESKIKLNGYHFA
ncbi:hypothetical protein BAU22_06570 [Bacillus sp. 4048]|uniref:hypothetical protein n=1 Tax=Bacillus sp. 4048 TaxID=1866310 RepID=UPI0008FDD9E7|nr:hypothetical protein [Bacillus sp. 4048]OJD51655.1 hypothetical protein BAU22_06570 [Bacillus sp. 4048]